MIYNNFLNIIFVNKKLGTVHVADQNMTLKGFVEDGCMSFGLDRRHIFTHINSLIFIEGPGYK